MHRQCGKNCDSGRRANPYRRRRSDLDVERLANKLGKDQRAILPILQGIAEKRYSFGSKCLGATADAVRVPDAQVAGVASFYSMLSEKQVTGPMIRLCDGPTCRLNGAGAIATRLESVIGDSHREGKRWCVGRSSCLGLCDRAPAALLDNVACGPLSDYRIGSVLQGWRGLSPTYREPVVGERRVAMARIGQIDPCSYASARQEGTCRALEEALLRSPEEIIAEIEQSGLCGCGGAGFPTGRKWRMVAEQQAAKKYVICNADESEPGAFKDRVLMENDPHLVLEGMMLAGFAVGADSGIIYVRGEYAQSAANLQLAIDQAEQHGWLGDKIQGTSFSFRIHIHRGAGAYICGEETALLESLEGRRGEPRLRPPYPTSHGYLGQPTVVNNVETLCRVPAIVRNGAAWYRSTGSPESPGTKIFSLSGHVRRPAAFESLLGITTRDIMHRIGLGMRSGSQFKMALTGGAAGTFVPESHLDVPIDFASINRGVALGSGVVILCDQSVSAGEMLEWILGFFRHESCGKCTPCREATRIAHETVRRIVRHDGQRGDLEQLRRLATMLETTSFCGLGKSIAMPIHSALDHFAEDFFRCGAS